MGRVPVAQMVRIALKKGELRISPKASLTFGLNLPARLLGILEYRPSYDIHADCTAALEQMCRYFPPFLWGSLSLPSHYAKPDNIGLLKQQK